MRGRSAPTSSLSLRQTWSRGGLSPAAFTPSFASRLAVDLGEDTVAERALGRGAVLAPGVFRLAFLPPVEQRGGDEDRGVGARGDADEEREGEVLQGRAAEEEERGDREEGDE